MKREWLGFVTNTISVCYQTAVGCLAELLPGVPAQQTALWVGSLFVLRCWNLPGVKRRLGRGARLPSSRHSAGLLLRLGPAPLLCSTWYHLFPEDLKHLDFAECQPTADVFAAVDLSASMPGCFLLASQPYCFKGRCSHEMSDQMVWPVSSAQQCVNHANKDRPCISCNRVLAIAFLNLISYIRN